MILAAGNQKFLTVVIISAFRGSEQLPCECSERIWVGLVTSHLWCFQFLWSRGGENLRVCAWDIACHLEVAGQKFAATKYIIV